jgi:YVTN family beta-propeller protein
MLKGVARRVPARCVLLPLCLAIAIGLGQEVIDSVDVGGWNVAGLTYNARAGVVYGGCFYGHSFFAISCSSNQIVSQITVVRPNDIAYAPLVNKAYCGFSNQGEDSILVIDGSTHTRIKAFPVLGAGFFAMDTLTNRLYMTCYYDDCVGVVDCVGDSVIGYIPIQGEPVHLTINARHRKLYCQNDYNMTVSVIDMNTNQVIRNVYTGSWYFAQCYSEVADKYYCDGAQGVAVIDGATDSVVKQLSLPLGYGPTAMVSVEPESLVMVAAYSGGADSVFMVDARTDSIRSALRCGSSPKALEYSSASNLVYCANSGWDNLSIISADGSRVLGTVPASDYPQDLLVCPEFEKLYVGHGGETNMLYIVRDRVGISEREATLATAARVPASVVTGTYRYDGGASASLVDASGRRVAAIMPGHNDLRALAPGVYAVIAPDARYRGRVVKLK